MEGKQIGIVTVIAVLAVVAGYFVGQGQGSSARVPYDPDDPEAAAVAEWQPGEGKAAKGARRKGARQRPTDEERPRVAALRRELDLKDAMLAGYQMRLGAGGWKDVAERETAAEDWHATVAELEEACAIDFDLVAIECGDVPCIAIVREREAPLTDGLGACEPWTNEKATLRTAPVDCGDGRTETAAFLAPGDVGDERVQALTAGFRCAPPPLKPSTP